MGTLKTCAKPQSNNQTNKLSKRDRILTCRVSVGIRVEDGNNAEPRENHVIRMNVSGMHFSTRESVLCRYPDTLLGDIRRRKKFYCKDLDEYFFDRHRPSFEGILIYYQTGVLKRPEDVPLDVFVMELHFFDMGENVITQLLIKEGYFVPKKEKLPQTRIKRVIWDLFERPGTSTWAKVITTVSSLFILLSVTTSCVETLPQFHKSHHSHQSNSDTQVNATEGLANVTSGNIISRQDVASQNPFLCIETVCVIWFVAELGLRFYACPSKAEFSRNALNVIDFVAILPYFVTVVLILTETSEEQAALSLGALRILRLVRVLRILQLTRHVKAIRLLWITVYDSRYALLTLLLVMAIGIVTSATGLYITEQRHPDAAFPSVPHSFWKSVITMTTVGYGETDVISLGGKIVAVVCAVYGILIMAILIPTFVDRFGALYMSEIVNPYGEVLELTQKEKLPKRRKLRRRETLV
ncbi:potassium voltage-gated channel subfamily A member 3-like [Branchiostoma floridae]|nr:potassium voltage-gated channel subfamily A member 3-like [Branchiostoma floridae]